MTRDAPTGNGPRDPDRALVVHPIVAGTAPRDEESRLDEACGLAEALDLIVADRHAIAVRTPSAALLFGAGKADDVGRLIDDAEAGVVVIDSSLSPVQQRNLERRWNAKVLDRTGLILEIFGRRARTKEGTLQVELARLAYERSRLVRTWTHLERQRGGRGFLGGPGETQIEADRRVIADRIARLRRDLEDVRRTRGLHRAKRRRVPFPLIALVGYTNAGKSTLFNRLTNANVLAKDMPFATLDPTLRSVALPSGMKAMLSDTVGFISDLPTDLVEAFQATLEEVREADLLVHVRDVAHADSDAQARDVDAILEGLQAGPEHGQPIVEAWNKADQLSGDDLVILRARVTGRRGEANAPILVSALRGDGIEDLSAAIDAVVTEGARIWSTVIQPDEGRALAWLHAHGQVLTEKSDEEGRIHVRARLSALASGRYQQSLGVLTPEDDWGRDGA